MIRTSLLLIANLSSLARTDSVGAPSMDGYYNVNNDELIETHGESWNDMDGQSEDNEIFSNSSESQQDEVVPIESVSIPNENVIFTCGGTAEGNLAYCQFPFTTLAGNEYTNKCADQVEDNPDVYVDRPWCFVSATDWGFCDCEASIDFTHLVTTNSVDKNKTDVVVQVSMDYPGTIWCYLEAGRQNDDDASKNNKPLSAIENGTVVGASTTISAPMIIQSMVATISFSVQSHSVHLTPVLACSANCTGLMIQPLPVRVTLGTNPADKDDEGEDDVVESTRPHLITRTSGALVYSIVMLMLLGSILGARYALNIREKLMFVALNQDDLEQSAVQYGLPLQVVTK